MAFPPRFLDDIRDRVALADVVGRRVKLVRRGREHLGLCPFHNEKTPSFTVNEDKGFYHCFGCGAHGDVIGFVMNAEKLGFREAVEQLAGTAGLPLPRETPEERAREQKRAGLAEAVNAAATWFAARLESPDGAAALAYLKGRGLDDAAIRRFRLGVAPDARAALKTALVGQGFEEALLIEAGLLIWPDDGRSSYDRFRGRVMFPITDRRGRTIAFGGRILGGEGPKYLNSPETPIFHKGRTLYNLERAAGAVRDGAELIVAEGYMDVIAMDRAGFHGAVAPLGTALTEHQLAALWRIAAEPILCFDGDEAGGRAAARAAERALPLLQPGRSLRFAMLPPGNDPDDLLASGGPAALRRVLDQAEPMSELVWQIEYALRPLDTPERKADLQRRLERRVAQIADRTVQAHYRAAFRDRLWRAFRRPPQAGRRPFEATTRHRPIGPRALADASTMRRRRQQVVLATVLQHPELADEFSDALARVEFDPDLDKVLQGLQKHLASSPDLDAETLKRHLSQDGHAAVLAVLSADDVRVHAPFARRESSAAEARFGLDEVLSLIFQARRREELKATARYTADNPDEETEARFLAFRKDVERGESRAREEDEEFDGSGGRSDRR